MVDTHLKEGRSLVPFRGGGNGAKSLWQLALQRRIQG